MFDPTQIHKTVDDIKKQTSELNVLNKNLKTKIEKKKEENQFPPVDEVEKPNKIEMEEI